MICDECMARTSALLKGEKDNVICLECYKKNKGEIINDNNLDEE